MKDIVQKVSLFYIFSKVNLPLQAPFVEQTSCDENDDSKGKEDFVILKVMIMVVNFCWLLIISRFNLMDSSRQLLF